MSNKIDGGQVREAGLEQEVVRLDFQPNYPQRELLKNFKRFNIFECHRRAGKTYISLWILVMQALQNKYKNGRYALVAPEEKQGTRNSADELVDICSKIPGAEFYKAERKIQLPNGAQIFILGIKNEDALRGGFWDGMVLDEFRDLKNAQYAWNAVIIPSLLKWETKERQGWVLITTTPPQKKHYYTELYNNAIDNDQWNVITFPITESTLFTEEEIDNIRATMNPTEFAIEMMCSHEIPAEGAFYTESLMRAKEQKRINRDVKYDPRYDVSVAIDIGIDGTALWFAQQIDRKIVLIDYFQDLSTDKKISFFINYMKGLPYRFNAVYLPHDTAKSNMMIDKTVFDEFKAAFKGQVQLLKREPIQNGIYRANTEFYRCLFSEKECREGLQALREYSPKKDSSKSSFTTKIDHNWASHGADAFRYLIKGLVELPPRSVGYGWGDGDYYNKYVEPTSFDPF